VIKEIVLATRNEGKVREFVALLDQVVETIMSLRELNSIPDVVEDEDTFRKNVLKKARFISRITQKITLADDSGLEVDALGGRPGIYSSRYAGENADDEENIRKLLNELKDVNDRGAKFVCNLALVFPSGEEIVVEGACEGVILQEPRGEGGFGYDPVFFLPELNKTMAELTPDEKNLISHRARAVRALVMYINGHKVNE
jgi:XTP/dITP diphosphohydrolase